MVDTYDELFSVIGNNLIDEYGHEVGRIISFTTTPNSRIKEILVSGKRDFYFYPRERIRINENGEAILLTEVKRKTNVLCQEIPLIWKKGKVLDELLRDERILPETYEEFNGQFENEKNKLKSEAEETIEDIEQLEKNCEERFRRLHLSKTHLEIEFALGKIKDDIYDLSRKALDRELDNVTNERDDLERMKKWLSNMILMEETTEEETEKKEQGEAPPTEMEQSQAVEEQEAMEPIEEEIKPAEEPSQEEPSITVRII